MGAVIGDAWWLVGVMGGGAMVVMVNAGGVVVGMAEVVGRWVR